MTVIEVTMRGFGGAGIDVFNITDIGDGRLVLDSNVVIGGSDGIHLESVSFGMVELIGNRLCHNTFGGIWLVSVDGVVICCNIVLDDGNFWIVLDDQSDGNLVVCNMVYGNEFDLSNVGMNNCFKRNRYVTSQGDIGC